MEALLCFIVLTTVMRSSLATDALVNTKFGAVKGFVDKAVNGRDFFSFKGIPFAEPPVGKLRFKDPVPLQKPWDGELDATKPVQKCAQPDLMAELLKTETDSPVMGQEDCLYLSVFSPKIGKGSNLPVMVFIHGGGFICGYADEHNPEFLLAEDIVLVVIQYRLGFLGFLSTEDDEAPGNLGLKDQTESLRWVRDNIAEFGGNPNSVTIFGESAGGASVSYQLLVEESKGLFQRAIMQSASANCIWAYTDSPRTNALEVARQLNCSNEEETLSSSQLVECLQDKNVNDIVLAGRYFPMFNDFPRGAAPYGDGKYLKAHPDELIAQGKFHDVDLIAGYAKDEGTLVTMNIYSSKDMIETLEKVSNGQAAFALRVPPFHTNAEQVALSIFRHYLGEDLDFLSKPNQLNQLYGDRFINICTENTKSAFIKSNPKSKAYWYEFSYAGGFDFHKLFPMPFLEDKSAAEKWVGHSSDVFYFFPNFFGVGYPTTEDDKKISRILVKLLTNFAATGKPTPTDAEGFVWEEATQERDWHLDISLNPTMKPNSRKEAVDFWNSLPLPENIRSNPEKFEEIFTGDGRKDEL